MSNLIQNLKSLYKNSCTTYEDEVLNRIHKRWPKILKQIKRAINNRQISWHYATYDDVEAHILANDIRQHGFKVVVNQNRTYDCFDGCGYIQYILNVSGWAD
jgi:hypothetical protein